MDIAKNNQNQSREQLRLRRHEHLWENRDNDSSQRFKSSVQFLQSKFDQPQFNRGNNRGDAFEYRGGTA